MVFNSFRYAAFLPTVLALYWLLRRRREQNILLLVASYIFYAAWDYRFLGLMWISTLTDYTVGRLLAATEDERRRKRIFLVSLCVNLGILGFFKYFNFFVDSGAGLLRHLGFSPHPPVLRILLPIGISFYTFHGISYTFDVYRRELEPTKSLLNFALFVAYFPQLVAGPIGRAQIQLPQFENRRTPPSPERIRSGLFLILLGLFKKIAIADMLAPFVNQAFGNAAHASAGTLIVGVYAFALQIYGDFSGYSDIARGSSRLFGIELLRNFDQPYLSRNITQFWRTWHISLSTWLRDYLYVPLGGNRKGERRTYVNLMATMLLGGLWHGAAWTFVMWGGLHGAYLSVHRKLSGSRSPPVGGWVSRTDEAPQAAGSSPSDPGAASVLQAAEVGEVRAPHTGSAPRFDWRRDLGATFVTFHVVCFAWIFFRASSFSQAARVIGGIVTLRSGSVNGTHVVLLLLAAAALFFIDVKQRNAGYEYIFLDWPAAARGVLYAAMVIPIVVFSGGTPVPFIYFQF